MLGIGISALDGYWTGIYNSETVVFRATGLPTVWDNSIQSTHPDDLPSDIADYLQVSAVWSGTTESWEPEVKSGSYGYGVLYNGYKSSVTIRNRETQPVSVTLTFDPQISGAAGWTLPLEGLRDGDSISPQAWSGTVTFTIPVDGYQYVKINSATVNISGCMDSTADNYNPDATQSDGSCEYRGCTDPNSLNYDGSANVDDGSCIEIVSGCTCSSADNYDSSANANDGTCVYPTSTDYKLPVEFVPPSLASIIRSTPPWIVECDTGWFISNTGKHTKKFNYNTSNTADEKVSLGQNYSGEPIELRIRPMPGYTITGTYNGPEGLSNWQATFDAPYISTSFPDGTYGGGNSAVWELNDITGPTETPDISDDNGETAPDSNDGDDDNQDDSSSGDSTGGSSTGSSTQITTYSNQTTAVEPETSTIWWPFFGLAVFATGVAWFMKEPKSF